MKEFNIILNQPLSLSVQLDHLANLGNVMNQPTPGPVGQSLPQSMATLNLGPPGPPGSPSKSFPTMNPQQQGAGGMGYNPMMGNQMPSEQFLFSP